MKPRSHLALLHCRRLSAIDIGVLEGIFPGVAEATGAGAYTGNEWCGTTFHDEWLLVNIQAPGVTFAITGPWHSGGP